MLPLYDDQHSRRFPLVTILIILANVAVFAGWQLRVGIPHSIEIGGMVPGDFLRSPSPGSCLHMVSAMFMHAGWVHLIGNMWFLWIFGNTTEDAMDNGRFFIFYFICGLAADFSHIYFSPNSTVPMIGASGAVSGVLGAYLMLHPKASITTLVPLGIFIRIMELPAWFFLLVWIGLQILSQFVEAGARPHSGGGIAYLAHIGGFAAGALLIFFFKNRR